ncbi:MAG TPA: PfaB family protein, partial [Leptolinea sp.]
ILGIIAGASSAMKTATEVPSDVTFSKAVKSANIRTGMIGLLQVFSSLSIFINENSHEELIKAFPPSTSPTCALTGGNGGLLSVVKVVWCLSQRVIPGTNDWSTPESLSNWNNSAFYVPAESRTWFRPAGQTLRYAGLIINDGLSQICAFIFKEGSDNEVRINNGFQLESFFMIPLIGNSLDSLQQKLRELQTRIKSTDLYEVTKTSQQEWKNRMQADSKIACILGHNVEELNREIDFALKGIPSAYEKNLEWRSPLGSYFTPQPLGDTGSLSFVYPGAFNSYPGVGRDLFYLFPTLYHRLLTISSNLSDLLNEKMLYPRSFSSLSVADLDILEKQLTADPLAMLISGTCLAALYTFLLRETFEIHPTSSFGYSLGEISMMFASGVWTQADETSAALRKSPLFQTRLAGPQNAIREYWKISGQNENSSDHLWANYVLMASPEIVTEAIKPESRLYLTHINTPRQVVIAGDPDSCRRVIDSLKCNALQAPFNYALHCEAMQSEYEALKQLHSWPVHNEPGMDLYSAATYQSMPIEQEAIARQIAYGLCHLLDFPRLINKAYSDGARIFIELGAGSNCARWVDDSLKDRPHAAFSINRKGVDDHMAILQLLAKLICHHIPVNLSSISS